MSAHLVIRTRGQTDSHGSWHAASHPKQDYMYILYGVCNAFLCLLHTFAQSLFTLY